MADRLKELTRLIEREPNDPFLRYGIAMEHKKAGRLDEALDWFARTLEADDTYCYAYYQQGQVHEQRGDVSAARSAYERGIERAKSCNDAHAAGEMQVAMELLEE
jgi:tetratricopeptide (TPR) repeat protein